MNTKKIHIATFGCQMNVDDSERMALALEPLGYAATDRQEEADLIVINTCSVRVKAEQKALSLLGRMKHLKKANPELRIALTGCVAQQEGQALLDRFEHLDLVLGTGAINRLPELLKRPGRFVDIQLAEELPVLSGAEVMPRELKSQVTIMQGCDNFCAYCIVPYVRGRERSRPPKEIIAEIEAKVAAGTREVNLLGQNVNSYAYQDWDFTRLLTEVDRIEGLWRLRFTTSHPKDMTPELIEAIGKTKKLCPFLHLPFQAGSDNILKAMNRGYTKAHYLSLVEALKKARPDLALSADCIVGFPGETEADFLETMDLLEKVRFDSLFSFRYSDRPGTRAARMENKVPQEDAARRLTILQARQREITLESNRAVVGSEVEILVEGPAKRGELLTGRTGTNKIVHFPGGTELIGRLVKVRVSQAGTNSLQGTYGDG